VPGQHGAHCESLLGWWNHVLLMHLQVRKCLHRAACLPACQAWHLPAAGTQAGVLAPAGPLHLLDLFPLTQHCGEECSTDGVHSLREVYDAALQLMLNVAAAGNRAQPRRRLWQRLPGRSWMGWLQTLKWR
jgi:hypothetical protein